jgi:hypothetical protein
MIAIASSAWIIIYRCVKAQRKMMSSQPVSVWHSLHCLVEVILTQAIPYSLELYLLTLWQSERDSRKDEAIVFIFIIATSGLLTWAACKPWVEKWLEVWGGQR